jgi:hypothetical protein
MHRLKIRAVPGGCVPVLYLFSRPSILTSSHKRPMIMGYFDNAAMPRTKLKAPPKAKINFEVDEESLSNAKAYVAKHGGSLNKLVTSLFASLGQDERLLSPVPDPAKKTLLDLSSGKVSLSEATRLLACPTPATRCGGSRTRGCRCLGCRTRSPAVKRRRRSTRCPRAWWRPRRPRRSPGAGQRPDGAADTGLGPAILPGRRRTARRSRPLSACHQRRREGRSHRPRRARRGVARGAGPLGVLCRPCRGN